MLFIHLVDDPPVCKIFYRHSRKTARINVIPVMLSDGTN